ncbi:hypothetical protein [Geodermatophilus obscurus]|uniref:hypothetical protein n=1 Tax=Geodermatophilus obscurus TaxID=1861 RepID=UPI00030DD030|nr:hypothetical protein [Geodermatophilus obscurus]
MSSGETRGPGRRWGASTGHGLSPLDHPSGWDPLQRNDTGIDGEVIYIAHNPVPVSLPVSALLPPEDDVTSLLSGPNSVSAHLAERLAAVATSPAR